MALPLNANFSFEFLKEFFSSIPTTAFIYWSFIFGFRAVLAPGQ